MRTPLRYALVCALLLSLVSMPVYSLNKQQIADSITSYANRFASVGTMKVVRVRQSGNSAEVYVNKQLSYLPFTEERANGIRSICKQLIFGSNRGVVKVFTDGHEISELIPGNITQHFALRPVTPLVTNTSHPHKVTDGLQGSHIALYGSHGIYFNQRLDAWKWQRAKILTTVEDLYTTSYTLPFLVPMLENAGAVVLYPRERDTHTAELVVDDRNATCSNPKAWEHTSEGGYFDKRPLFERENPFTLGGYAVSKQNHNEQPLIYRIAMPQEDDYAVYVSYKTIANSTEHAKYEIVHKGIHTTFSVNQKMGGGTWIYVGTFRIGTNDNENYISLSNIADKGEVVTSDAVKIGGGIGHVARYRGVDAIENVKSSDNETLTALLSTADQQISEADSLRADSIARLDAFTSGYPRWIEGSRYFFQYAGIPDSVYNFTDSKNDYTDDYASRGRWVNYLAGGSQVYPDGPGLGIPVNLFLAFHSDAGTTLNDSIIGTLIIYNEFDDEKKYEYENGVTRLVTRNYADLMQTQIVEDMRALYAPEWQRRQLMNSSYAEARNPKMPAVLLELLSHQNFADLRYGLDPRVRFSISRSIYKSMLRFLEQQNRTQLTIQPLPVHNFAIRYDNQKLRLSWDATSDMLEPTADATFYVLYTRTNDGDWDNGQVVKGNSFSFVPQYGVRYDFRVHAANKGGLSMPSEVLSACIFSGSKDMALVVNGFTRVGAPECFVDSTTAGFRPDSYGVPYLKDVCYIGPQYEFLRSIPWMSDDNQGFGASYANYATSVMAGNMFDYPSRHGRILQAKGISYVSTSMSALQEIPEQFTLVDIILGKQKQTTLGVVKHTTDFKTFDIEHQQLITDYVNHGGKLLVSGAYIATDLNGDANDRLFLNNTLHAQYATHHATTDGNIDFRKAIGHKEVKLQTTPDEELTVCEDPDGIDPQGEGAICIGRYNDTQVSAAVAWQSPDKQNKARTLVYAFPLESTLQFGDLLDSSITWLLK